MNTALNPKLMQLRGIRTAYAAHGKDGCNSPAFPALERAEIVRWLVAGVRGFCRNTNTAR